jgi:type IV pilus assembly protein PilB
MAIADIESSSPLTPAHKVIPEALAKELMCIGLRWQNNNSLLVGISDQLSDAETKAILVRVKKEINLDVEAQEIAHIKLSQVVENSFSEVEGENFSAPSFLSRDKEGPIAELVSNILQRSIDFRASDIHIEPTATDVHVRIRVDGKLETLTRLKAELGAPIISRMKVLARMNIVERRRPQDGQFSFAAHEKNIDLRLATVATLYGEKTVLRVLDSSKAITEIEDLGISKQDLDLFNRMANSSFGLIVAAGPTGSGKTTTLHSALRDLNTPERNLTTLEDPVEYIVEGVNHIPVDESIGAGFATQLRAILRQDPDVVLLGETRDGETAKIAIQGALSGRLVLTSLHAPDAVGAIYRLFQMEIEPHLVAAAINGIVAQRLVRRICVYCKETYTATAAERVMLRSPEGKKTILARGIGCTMCRGTGYYDRVGVFQLLEITDNMRELISRRPNPNELYALARKEKMRTLEESALSLVATHETTLEEISYLIEYNS